MSVSEYADITLVGIKDQPVVNSMGTQSGKREESEPAGYGLRASGVAYVRLDRLSASSKTHSATLASRSPLAPNLTVFAFQHERMPQLGRSDLHRGFEGEDRRFEREERGGLRSFCVGGGHGGGGIGRSRCRGGGLKGVESHAASCIRARVQL
ncbi:hypothetical protein C8J57DRAFT_1230867 [Mycena rebaudengoi]|nr:hypothetical protein C8J57DRAFT_1230867 [Mycena rebaudengoi]